LGWHRRPIYNRAAPDSCGIPREASLLGRTLSHYRIIDQIGTGGMGEVYRATDTSLGRDVAIKVLPPDVAQDPDRLGRFRREAHLLASLNHPNIAAIYGLEEEGGQPFLALELVEGEDLKQRLGRGAIPVDEALEIAKQVAEALEEAHGKGIVHRDLKPANVKLTPSGKVKVLDFGLAKAWAGEAADSSSPSAALSRSPTLANTGTMAGLILGTAAYMSPEQARGKLVDKRADVWSFGVLLWEMLTGHALFGGDTVTDVIAAVVTREPDLGALPPATPPAVRQTLARCLRKDPRMRLPDIGAARLELQDLLAGTESGAEAPAVDAEVVRNERRSRARELRAWAAAALALAVLAGFLVRARLTARPEPRPIARFALDVPNELAFDAFDPLSVSPDGRYVAFSGNSAAGPVQLWIRPLDSPEARAFPGTNGAGGPFWSPDSATIAFVAGNEIRKLVLASGTVQRVCALPRPAFTGGTWSTDGTIVFSSGGGSGSLYSVSAAGGEAKPLTTLDAARGERGHWWPQFLPDGRRLLFDVGAAKPEDAGLHVASLDAPRERRRILPEEGRYVYVDPGYLLAVQDGILTARRFDARSLSATGEAVPIASSVGAWSNFAGYGWFSASATGVVAWLSAFEREVRLEWLDRAGQRLGTLGEHGNYGQITLSPDDRRIAAEIPDGQGQFDIWTIDVARGVESRLTTDPANERDPVWSPDSQELVFSSDKGGDQDVVRIGIQGGSTASPLRTGVGATRGVRDIAECWARAGDTLVYTTIGEGRAIWTAALDGDRPPEPLLKSGFGIDEPNVSRDGRWLAYISNESGRYEVYVEPFKRRGEKLRLSANGGGQPRWRGDGRELFYLSAGGQLMAVSVREVAAGLEIGMPTVLVEAANLRAVVLGPDYDDYAVTADGRRFLVKSPVKREDRQRLHVLLNWPSMLER
jgi:Tol biopolymer transport system component